MPDARLTVAAAEPSARADTAPAREIEPQPAARRGGYAVAAAVAAVLFWIALDRGSFGIESRTSLAIVAWWGLALAVSLGIWPRVRPRRETVAALGALAGLAAITGASMLWAPSVENAFSELARVLLYAGVFCIAAFGASRETVGRWCDGAAIAVAGVGLLAITTRLFPDLLETREALRFLPYGRTRLNYPVGYWNGLAILLALGLPLLLRAALLSRGAALRGLAVAPLPALIGAIYLTSSRTGVLAAAAAVLVYLALTPRRVAAACALLVGGAGGAAVVALLASRDAVVNGPLGGEAAVAQGRGLALPVLAVCLASGLVYGLGVARSRSLPAVGRRAERLTLAVVAGAVVLGVLLADPVDRIRDFKRLPAETSTAGTDVESHLLGTSGNGRWQMWTTALDEFRADPLLGGGAGSFQSWWEQHRPLELFVRDAHSLYLETLAELGLAGGLFLALLLTALATAVVRGFRAGGGEQRLTLAALTAAFVAFAVGAAADWMWEFTVVGIAGLAVAGLLTGPAARPAGAVGRPGPSLARIAAVFAVALAVIAVQLIPLLSDLSLHDSAEAARRGDLAAAREHALDARSVAPWAESPHVQVALIEEQAGNFRSAAEWMREAVERDPSDWRLWLVKARIETEAGQVAAARRSLARARERNPLAFADERR